MTRRSLIKPVEEFTGCKFYDRDKHEYNGRIDRYIRFINGNTSYRVVVSEDIAGISCSLEHEKGGRFAGDRKIVLRCNSHNRKNLYEGFIFSLNSLGKLQ